jgi:hypothetical protein
LQIENYTLRARNEYIHQRMVHNQVVKSIVQPAHTVSVSANPHIFIYEQGYNCVNENFELVSTAASRNMNRIIQLNHYFTRSYQDFKDKIRRGKADTGGHRSMNDFFEVDRYANEVYDDKILRFLPQLKTRLNEVNESGSEVPIQIRRFVHCFLSFIS